MLKRGSRTCTRIYRGNSRKRLLIRGHRAVFRDPDYVLPGLAFEMVNDTAGQWFEVSFIAPSTLTGSAATGWTWSNASHHLALQIETSTDLQTWAIGNVTDAPGSPATVTGGYEYKARCTVPSRWNSVMCDLTMSSERAGKSITELRVKNAAVSLPNYPYALPADAADLQADLRAAGYDDATVTIDSRPLSVIIRNHTPGATHLLQSTVVSAAVTQVRAYISSAWTPISLPGYPYALPVDQADLQADLRTAGYTGAVVNLLGDEWTVHIPDILAGGQNRSITCAIDPGDPFPSWDAFGIYQGLAANNVVVGTSDNVRTPAGAPLLEAPKQFARLRVTRTNP